MRFWKKRLQRVAAMVCSVALVASMMPTAAFATEPEPTPTPEPTPVVETTPTPEPSESPVSTDATVSTSAPDTDADSTFAPEATPAGNTDGTPAPSGEPTGTPDGTPAPSEKPVESPEPSEVPAEQEQPAPQMLAAAPTADGEPETRSGPDGTNSELGNEYITVYYNHSATAADNRTLTVKVQDETGTSLCDDLTIGNVTLTTMTRVTLDQSKYAAYKIQSCELNGGSGITQIPGSLNNDQNKTFTLNTITNNSVLVVTLQQIQNDIIDLTDSKAGGKSFGSILYKEDESVSQTTNVHIYLNNEFVKTVKDLKLPSDVAGVAAGNGDSFVLTLNDGYYFAPYDVDGTVEVCTASTVSSEQHITWCKDTRNGLYSYLNYSLPNADGTNDITLNFFTYEEGVRADFTRYVNGDTVYASGGGVSAACEDLNIRFTYNGIDYTVVYDTWGQAQTIFLPRGTYIYVAPAIKDGFSFVYWLSEDSWTKGNSLYSVLPDGSLEQEETGLADEQKGLVALTQTMAIYYNAGGYVRAQIGLHMTDGGRPGIYNEVYYHSNYPVETGKENETETAYYYPTLDYGTRIENCMFSVEGYTFAGWNTQEDGTGTPYTAGQYFHDDLGNDLTLYAQWEKIETPPEDDKPDAPDGKTLRDLGLGVRVQCTTKPDEHGNVVSTIRNTSVKFGDVVEKDGHYECVATISAAEYIERFNDAAYGTPGHTGKDTEVQVVLTSDGKGHDWELAADQDEIIAKLEKPTAGGLVNQVVTFEVTCEEETTEPDDPTAEDIRELGAKIKVYCDTPNSGHKDAVWEEVLRGAAPKDFVIEHDALSNTATVTIKNTDVYVKVYNEKVAPGHAYQKEGSDLSFKLKYENDAWALDPEDTATIRVYCIPDPTAEDIRELGAKINVDCDTPNSGHEDDVWEEDLRGAAPKDFEIKHDALSNTATVTIKNTDVYVKVYNEKVAPGHVYQEDGSDLSFGLVYENGKWNLDTKNTATIHVYCIPDPTAEDIRELGAKIKVDCDTPNSGHEDAVWEEVLRGAAPKDFEIKHDALSNTATVTIKNTDVYVKVYNEKVAPGHVYQKTGSDLSFKLKYDKDAWVLDPEDSTATILVSCPKATVKKAITGVVRDGKPLDPVPEMLKVGDKINYQIEITNDSNITLEDLTVTDTFTGEGGFTFGSVGTGSVKMNDEGFVWSLDIAPKDSEVLNYSYTVVDADKGNTITNTATVAGAGLPDEPGDKTETKVENPAVGVEKSLVQVKRGEEIFLAYKGTIPEQLEVGDELTYEIEVKNIGNVKLNGLTLTDTFNGHFAPSKVKDKVANVELTNEWEKDTTTGLWTLKIENISPDVGEIETYTYTYTVNQADAGNNLTNTAAMTGDELDPDDPDDEGKDEHPVKDDGDITLQPADITIYMGGEDGYAGAAGGDSSSLPEPGFYITLPADVEKALHDAGYSNGEAADLSGVITEVTATTTDGVARRWTMQKYGESASTAWINNQEHFVYRIVPGENQPAISVNFTNEDGTPVTEDKFTLTDSLSETYFMSLNTASVDVETISLTFNIKDQIFHCGYDAKNSQEGTLTVRYASEEHDTTKAVTSENDLNPDTFGVVVGSKQLFNINQKDAGADGVDVTAKDVSLLVDSLVGGEDYAYTSELYSKAVTAAGFKSSGVWGQYLDLVDAENGNAWLTPEGEVTVFWPYPAGVTKDTGTIKLYHFEGLDRDMATGDVMAEINNTDAVEVQITRLDDGFTFKTSSFSPFVLVQDTTQPSGGEDKPSGGDDGNNDNNNNNTNNNTNTNNQTTTVNVANQAAAPAAAPAAAIPQTGDAMPVGLLGGLAAAAAAGFAALFVIRKRKRNG